MFSFQLVSVYSAHTEKAPRRTAPRPTLGSPMQLLVAALSPPFVVFTKIMEFDARFIDRNQAKSINGKCNQFYGQPSAMIRPPFAMHMQQILLIRLVTPNEVVNFQMGRSPGERTK